MRWRLRRWPRNRPMQSRLQEEAKEDTTPSEEGTLVDPNTGETVKMPTEEEVQAEGDDGFLGGYESPILPGGGGSAEE